LNKVRKGEFGTHKNRDVWFWIRCRQTRICQKREGTSWSESKETVEVLGIIDDGGGGRHLDSSNSKGKFLRKEFRREGSRGIVQLSSTNRKDGFLWSRSGKRPSRGVSYLIT